MYKLLALPLVVLGLSLGFAPSAWATQPTLETGTLTLTSHVQTLIHAADGNLAYAAVDISVDTGVITGTTTDTYTFTGHPDGMITGQGRETCSSCTIDGRTGSYTANFTFFATATFSQFHGQFTFVSGQGGLAGLRGEGTYQGGGNTGTFTLNIHFEA
jgi:hypothetical protein